jgi:hypothetical protein
MTVVPVSKRYDEALAWGRLWARAYERIINRCLEARAAGPGHRARELYRRAEAAFRRSREAYARAVAIGDELDRVGGIRWYGEDE